MSQHADIVTHLISKGIRRNDDVDTILADIGEMLCVLEYADEFLFGTTLQRYVYDDALNMRLQKDWLYGVSHEQLDKFLDEMWLRNQWLPTRAAT